MEVICPQEPRNLVVGVIVDQDRPEHCDLGIGVVGEGQKNHSGVTIFLEPRLWIAYGPLARRNSMTVVYKLTDTYKRTHGGFGRWEARAEFTAPGGGKMCSDAYLHAYADPILAVLMNPVHANFVWPRMFECEANVEQDDGTKLGCTRIKVLREIEAPQVTREQATKFGILAAKAVYHEPKWNRWAEDWLSGKDRSARAVRATRCLGVAAAAASAANAMAANGMAAKGAAARAAKMAATETPIDLVAIAKEAVQ
ncbi:MAG: hypothetical protein ACE5FS_03400 [Paracoccaceae bacterium]